MLHYVYPVHYRWENIDFVYMLLGLYIYMDDTILAEDRTMRKLCIWKLMKVEENLEAKENFFSLCIDMYMLCIWGE